MHTGPSKLSPFCYPSVLQYFAILNRNVRNLRNCVLSALKTTWIVFYLYNVVFIQTIKKDKLWNDATKMSAAKKIPIANSITVKCICQKHLHSFCQYLPFGVKNKIHCFYTNNQYKNCYTSCFPLPAAPDFSLFSSPIPYNDVLLLFEFLDLS